MSILNRAMKNKTIGVTLLDTKNATDAPVDPNANPYEGVEIAAMYSEIAKDFIAHAAFTIGGVWAACKIVERVCR